MKYLGGYYEQDNAEKIIWIGGMEKPMTKDQDIRKVLKDIMEFIGADIKYAEYAHLRRLLELLIDRNHND